MLHSCTNLGRQKRFVFRNLKKSIFIHNSNNFAIEKLNIGTYNMIFGGWMYCHHKLLEYLIITVESLLFKSIRIQKLRKSTPSK